MLLAWASHGDCDGSRAVSQTPGPLTPPHLPGPPAVLEVKLVCNSQNTFMFLTAPTLIEVCTVCPEQKLRKRRRQCSAVQCQWWRYYDYGAPLLTTTEYQNISEVTGEGDGGCQRKVLM